MLNLQITNSFSFANKTSYVNVKRKSFLKTGHLAKQNKTKQIYIYVRQKRSPLGNCKEVSKLSNLTFVSNLVILIALLQASNSFYLFGISNYEKKAP